LEEERRKGGGGGGGEEEGKKGRRNEGTKGKRGGETGGSKARPPKLPKTAQKLRENQGENLEKDRGTKPPRTKSRVLSRPIDGGGDCFYVVGLSGRTP
jgi:hypothetical protein